MTRLLWFAGAMALLIGLETWLIIAVFGAKLGPDGVRAIVTSAGVAFVVQLLTFGIAKAMASTNVIAGFVGGTIVVFLVVAIHGFFGAPLLGLPVEPSLGSLAAFFFQTRLLEILFLAPSDPKAPSSAQ